MADALTVVEWPNRLGGLTPSQHLEIELAAAGTDARMVRMAEHGGRWQERLEELRRSCAAAGLAEEDETGTIDQEQDQ